LDQTALFNFTSTRTSDVFIIFCAKVLICLFIIIAEEERRERESVYSVSSKLSRDEKKSKSKKKVKKSSLVSPLFLGSSENFCLSRARSCELKKRRTQNGRLGRNQHTREHKYTPRAFPPPISRRVFRETHPASRFRDPISSFSFPPKKTLGAKHKSALDQKQAHFGAQREKKKHRKSRPNDTYRLHRARSSLLKSNSVSRFAQVDGVFSRYDVVGTHFFMCYVR